MDIDIPGAGAVQARSSLEEDLSAVFTALLADDRNAFDTVMEICQACQQRAEMLRAEASEQLHRPARHMSLKAQAEEMEAQAATWQLLFCLYCLNTPLAGDGGPALKDVGGVRLYRQRLADQLKVDRELARCARVVAWLELLSDESLKRQGGATFAPGEGIWHETKTEMLGGKGSVVAELDPDAPGRTGRPLHPSNGRSQERVLARVWQLLRAGRMPNALELLQHVGQPWRAAALEGGGPFGFLPLGCTATQYDEEVDEQSQYEELADEVCNGSGTMLALWRWAAQQAAAAPPGDKFERAVFGALGGSTAAEAPACASWEDCAWSYCRSWLESQLFRSVPPERHSSEDLVPADELVAALVRCGANQASAQRSVEGAMAVVLAGGVGAAAPGPYDSDGSVAGGGAGATSSSRGFGHLFAQHVMTPGSLVNSGSPAVQAMRQVQGLLVGGDMHALVCHLFNALVERGPVGSGAAAADGGAVAAGGDDGAAPGAGAGPGTNPERRWRTLALMVHMLVALEGLGVLTGEEDTQRGHTQVQVDPFELQKTVTLSQQLLGFYAARLLERGELALVPPYLCALRQQLRSSLCGELLALHTRKLTGLHAVASDAAGAAEPPDEAARVAAANLECYTAFRELSEWFRRCLDRQQQPQEALTSKLATDIRPNELRSQLVTFALACRNSHAYGPHQRARVARWLTYPYLEAAQAAEADATAAAAAAAAAGEDGSGAAGEVSMDDIAVGAAARLDPVMYYDVLDYANCLCCELALGDDVTASAGHLLFEEVLPEDLNISALAAAQTLTESAAAAEARAAEAEAEADAGADADHDPQSLFNRQQQRAAAATAREEAAQASSLAAVLRDQASELAQWRLFFRLDGKLAQWTARHEALAGASGPEAAEEEQALVADGGALLQAYLIELLQDGWQEELSTAERALSAAAETPEGVVRVTLTVVSPPGPTAGAPPGASTWGQPTASYPGMEAFPLLSLKMALQEGLQRAAATARADEGAAVDVSVAEGPGEPPGHVAVTLTAPAELPSWRLLVDLVCAALRGGLEGLPSLLLVGLEADRATSLAVCRRCCIGQAILRCAGLRLSLVALGASVESPETGPQLLELLAAPHSPAYPTCGSGLLGLLTPLQLAHVLKAEGDTVAQHQANQQLQRPQLLMDR